MPVTFRGDYGPVAQALLNSPQAVAAGYGGEIYVADTGNHRVRRIDPDGVIHPVAGTGERAFRGDGGPAPAAALQSPQGLAVARDGTVYIADTGNHRVRKVTPDGVIETVAGDGHARFEGDGGPAIAASINTPTQLVLDGAGALYILDSKNLRIRRVDANGTISTIFGANPLQDYPANYFPAIQDGTSALNAGLKPLGFGVAPGGTLYVYDREQIWRVDDGLLRRWLVFQPSGERALDGPVPLEQLVIVGGPIAVGSDGTVYINTALQLLAVRNGIATRVSDGTGSSLAIDPANGDAISISPAGLIRQTQGGSRRNLWTAPTTVTVLPAVAVDSPLQARAVAAAPDGTVYIAESTRILALDTNGQLRLFAGSPTGWDADGTPALSAALSNVKSLAVDTDGAVYFLEQSLRRVRKIGKDGLVRTAFATVNAPVWLRIDRQNRLYVFNAAGTGSQVRRYDPDGTSTLVTPAVHGGIYWGNANIQNYPGMAVTPDGTVYVGATDYTSLVRISPGGLPEPVPMPVGTFPAVLSISDDGGLYLGARDGRIQKILSDGTTVTIRNREGAGFWGENGFDSEPLPDARLYDFASDGRGGLLAVDSSVRRIAPGCAVMPGPTVAAVLESATGNYQLHLAAGQLISIYGLRLGPDSGLTAAPNSAGYYPTELDGTQVLVGGVASPLLYAGANQINAVVPFSVDGQTTVPLEVVRNGRRSDVRSEFLRRTGPAIISYVETEVPHDLYARMLNEDGSINGPDHPAKLGSVVTVYASGLGITAPDGVDGKVADLNLKRPIHPLTLTVQGYDVEILYAGTAPGIVEGVSQVNFRLPKEFPGFRSPTARIYVGIAEGVPQPNRLLFYFVP